MRGKSALALAMVLLTVPAAAAERLQVPQLAGWKVVTGVVDRAGEATDLIPASETPETWTRRATVQGFRGVGLTVAGFLDQVVAKTAEVCDGAAAGPASLGTVSGAEAGSRTVACGSYKGDGRGSYTLYYAIRGREAFYVVSRSWRGAPFAVGTVPVPAPELAEWAAWVHGLDLCDTRDANRPCR
ncbi:hypothetical protein [Magnetospirillum sp. UT-4]|uniref:hypothetical protein n=1 Tax=Magnetospirillum sp. UT-4 TaxID=2681467 RepID=UPI0013819692|nr:hypothetical protein [Magnetospirillum sp. UT-4]CAA7611790.1 conserved exported hypothetical protein [Magnetospirillum sp. UT-4]